MSPEVSPNRDNLWNDNLTGCLTPYGELLHHGHIPESKRVFVDWQDMHSSATTHGGIAVANELAILGRFLRKIFGDYGVTHLSGDNFFIISQEGFSTVTKTLRAATRNAVHPLSISRGKLITGLGFPDDMTRELLTYWQLQPHNRFQEIRPPLGQSVGVIDIRHLKSVTQELGIPRAEEEVAMLRTALEVTLGANYHVQRTRPDEVWAFGRDPVRIREAFDTVMSLYPFSFQISYGVGRNLLEADLDMNKNSKPLIADVGREQTLGEII